MQTFNVSYSTIQTILTTIPSYYVEQGDGGFDIYAVGSEVLIHCRLMPESNGDVDDFITNYKDDCTAVASGDDALILGNVENKIPFVQPRTPDGKIRIAQEKTEGDRVNFFSIDYTDPTTWYPQSTRVTSELAEDDGDHTTYNLDHSPVVDLYHGRVTQEDELRTAQGQTYRVAVTVTPSGGSAQAKVEQDPHFGAGGDYLVDYENGKITFLAPLAETDEVRVTYHWVNMGLQNGTASRFTVAPSPGKTLSLEIAECQFSTDVEPNDTVIFEVWGFADAFLSPAQMAAYGIPAGIGFKIKLSSLKYKTLGDFQNDAFRVYPAYAAMGSQNNWRAQKQPVTVFDWDYLTSVKLLSSAGMEIRVFLEHDAPFGGWMGVATFYCKSEVER